MEAPYILHALPSQTANLAALVQQIVLKPNLVRLSLISFLNGTKKLYHFILDIMDQFWLAKTSNKPISLTTTSDIFRPG